MGPVVSGPVCDGVADGVVRDWEGEGDVGGGRVSVSVEPPLLLVQAASTAMPSPTVTVSN